jgi:hypothetical protein
MRGTATAANAEARPTTATTAGTSEVCGTPTASVASTTAASVATAAAAMTATPTATFRGS